MQILSGKDVSREVMASVKEGCADYMQRNGRVPCLAVILVGDDPASATYVANKGKACEEVGFAHRTYHLGPNVSETELLALIKALNEEQAVDGILVQLPLPSAFNERVVISSLCPDKDVDGLHPVNIGRLLAGDAQFVPCTPAGILRMLDVYHISTSAKEVVILGRSNIVGKPMAALLMQKGRDATVTVCHSKTENLSAHTRRADILIAAMGKPLAVTKHMVQEGAVVIDVGINRIEDPMRKRGFRLVGDVDYEQVAPLCAAITPVPGGVGPMTIAMLMENTLQAAILHALKEIPDGRS